MTLAGRLARLTTPDRALGRSLLKARMLLQTVPDRVSSDPERQAFLGTCTRVVPRYSMLSVDRLRSLYRLSSDLARRGVEGAIVECGCWNGGGAATIAEASVRAGQLRDTMLFDSFEGLPVPTADDPPSVHEAYFAGWCRGDMALAREAVRGSGIPDDRIHVVKGWFESTLAATETGPIAFLHVDSDWYESVKVCIDVLVDRVVPGGVIVFDDYRYWGGCTRAVDEFVARRGWQTRLQSSGRVAVYLVV